ncbi:DUF2663 family protein [Paenibacillus roseipurpureus]|uniref:DUF2663 family protein n=1 Tax=Paenibacillus roseopurpureus TaxID=2918901 RepID=A0AA96LNY5_9BACL|nr:DUF2663 family protein [Paenibacillus sp. MBLB1832]WNR43314.1 DUF2663 family protein [Paenibacillus sp. MBLB1832]
MFVPINELSEDSQVMLKELSERKEKLDRLKRLQPLLSILAGGTLLGVIYLFHRLVIMKAGGNAMVILDMLISNRWLCALMLVCLSLFLYASSRSKETDKAKSKYEDLRTEVIERFDASWLRDLKSEVRDHVSRYLSSEFDINIRYKS